MFSVTLLKNMYTGNKKGSVLLHSRTCTQVTKGSLLLHSRTCSQVTKGSLLPYPRTYTEVTNMFIVTSLKNMYTGNKKAESFFAIICTNCAYDHLKNINNMAKT